MMGQLFTRKLIQLKLVSLTHPHPLIWRLAPSQGTPSDDLEPPFPLLTIPIPIPHPSLYILLVWPLSQGEIIVSLLLRLLFSNYLPTHLDFSPIYSSGQHSHIQLHIPLV